jgi:hypothetical protein
MIGDAPEVLTGLNPVELALITKTVTQCQRFFVCWKSSVNQSLAHLIQRQVRGNIGTLTLMTESEWKGKILVVMCGPFTNEQYLKTKAKTSVNPDKVIAAFKWLKENKYCYQDIEIPISDDIPHSHISWTKKGKN